MPKLGKESQDETRASITSEDVAKLVRQQLDTLRKAGMTHLPKGTGQYSFEVFETPKAESNLETGPKTTGVEKPTSGSASSSVGESLRLAFVAHCAPYVRHDSCIAYLDEPTFLQVFDCGWINVPQDVVPFFSC